MNRTTTGSEGGRVVFCDEDPGVRRALTRMLHASGWAVHEAADARGALALVDDRRPDVVLTALRMRGGMDGVALVEALSQRAPGLPVIVMSGATDIASAGRAMRAGAVDHVTKPIEPRELLRALTWAASRGRPERSPGADGDPAREPRCAEKILLVVGDDDVRVLLHRLLERAGYAVLSAGSAAEAQRVSEREPGKIDLLLTDIAMPGSNGIALARALSDARPEMRVLYISAYTYSEIALFGELPDEAELFPKPTPRDALLERVRMVLDAAEPPGT